MSSVHALNANCSCKPGSDAHSRSDHGVASTVLFGRVPAMVVGLIKIIFNLHTHPIWLTEELPAQACKCSSWWIKKSRQLSITFALVLGFNCKAHHQEPHTSAGENPCTARTPSVTRWVRVGAWWRRRTNHAARVIDRQYVELT